MEYCVKCKLAVEPYCGAFFKLDDDYYHADCWPEEENIAATFFTGSGEGSRILSTKVRSDDDKA